MTLQDIPIVLVIFVLDLSIDSQFVIPGHAAYFLLDSSVFSILQFLGNFLHSPRDEDGPSSPIHYTNVVLSR